MSEGETELALERRIVRVRVDLVPLAFQCFIGVAEIAGAVGIIIPAALHLLTWLTPVAALGLAVVGFSVAVFHFRRREISMVPVVLVLGLLAAFVAHARTSAPL